MKKRTLFFLGFVLSCLLSPKALPWQHHRIREKVMYENQYGEFETVIIVEYNRETKKI